MLPTYQRDGFTLIDGTGFLWGDRYQQREARQSLGFLACIACGRDTSKQGNSQGVCVTGGGGLIIKQQDYDRFPHGGGDMGWFPVGAECIKQIPADFRAPNPYRNKTAGVNPTCQDCTKEITGEPGTDFREGRDYPSGLPTGEFWCIECCHKRDEQARQEIQRGSHR